jgi:3',5'-cyclic AMP phosphodiesterase CpdA
VTWKKVLSIVSVGLAIAVLLNYPRLAGSGQETQAVEDLRPLAELNAAQGYEALIRTVQSSPIVAGGFTFVVMGDSRNNVEIAQEIYRRAAQEKPAFIIHTGDLVHNGTVDEYLHYHMPLVDQIKPAPVIPVPGNHDGGPGHDFYGYLAIYGSDHFSFSYGDCRFVGVNNSDGDRLSDNDLQFLGLELSKQTDKLRFVFMHIPPLFVEEGDNGGSWFQKRYGFKSNAPELRQLMKDKGVQGVFFGHDHGFAERDIDGLHYFITGGGGAHLHPERKWLKPFYHYLVVHVTPEKTCYELVRLDGRTWVRTSLTTHESQAPTE